MVFYVDAALVQPEGSQTRGNLVRMCACASEFASMCDDAKCSKLKRVTLKPEPVFHLHCLMINNFWRCILTYMSKTLNLSHFM